MNHYAEEIHSKRVNHYKKETQWHEVFQADKKTYILKAHRMNIAIPNELSKPSEKRKPETRSAPNESSSPSEISEPLMERKTRKCKRPMSVKKSIYKE